MAQCNQGNSGDGGGGSPYAPGNPYSPGRPYCGYCYGPYNGFPSNPDAPIDSECLPNNVDPCAVKEVSHEPCPNSICDERFADLPPTKRMSLVGIVGSCMYRFLSKSIGFIVSDEVGQSVTNRPCVPIPFLKDYQTDAEGNFLKDANGDLLEGPTPKFDSMLGFDDCACMNRIQGVNGKRQRPIWDGQAFCFVEDREADVNPLLDPKDVPIITEDDGLCPAPIHALLIPTSKTQFVDGVEVTVYGYTIGGTQVDPVPVGVMNIWPGESDNVPETYMFCDGASLNIDDWPALFAAIGYGWGGGGQNFNIPDARGQFLRGVDTGQNVDPDAADRIELKPGGNTGDAVGSFQEDQMQCFSATYDRYYHQSESVRQSTAGGSKSVARNSDQYTQPEIQFVDGGCGDPRFGDETRPSNIYVNYIIKTGCPPVPA